MSHPIKKDRSLSNQISLCTRSLKLAPLPTAMRERFMEMQDRLNCITVDFKLKVAREKVSHFATAVWSYL